MLIHSYLLGKKQEVIRSEDRIVESISFFEDYFETDILHEVQKKEFISEPIYSSETTQVNSNDPETAKVTSSFTSIDNQYQTPNDPHLVNVEVEEISFGFTNICENIDCVR